MDAPLPQTKPDYRALGAAGGFKRALSYQSWPAWKRALPATLRAMRRWSPDSPVLRMDRADAREAYRLGWEAGFKSAAGYKRS